MDARRRNKAIELLAAASVAAGLLALAWALPDDGLLDWVGWAASVLGVLAAVTLPFGVWAVATPEASDRWAASPGTEPLPMAVPAVWWILSASMVGALWLVGMPRTLSDGLWLVVPVAAAMGGIACACRATIRYRRDRRTA